MLIFILFILTIVAFWLSAICGGGASLILIPILGAMLPGSQVPFALTTGTLSSSVSRIVLFRKYISWKVFWIFVPFSVPAVILGGWLLKYINPDYLQLLVAIFLISNVPELLKRKSTSNVEGLNEKKYKLAIIGFLAGFVSGVTGAVGLLFNKFYFKLGLSKEEIIATRAANEIFLHTLKLAIYIYLGLATHQGVVLGLTVAAGAIVSSYTVKYILPYLTEYTFKRIGMAAMVLSGIILFSTTTKKIYQSEHISYESGIKNNANYTSIKFNKRNFLIEFSENEGIEIEKIVHQENLLDKL
ncbi:sulfite exporter TauE/SafE family protein [Rhizosphaericola mali]|uniref:Probable membrane transporter protein n=1 Tax=Rhizosphaericola mali TaxID=2545455 RepID=A0A5P2G808_9BACT|nr:sulfite exporter TauE/SafE family protein [Rhizosphaericola mali]QES90052.1 sulfite exporter TauE/SafE family protein [Rhizosphaericola mali]